MTRAIIDRFEGDLAVLEYSDGTFASISLDELPKNVKQHDCLKRQGNTWVIDEKRTKQRKDDVRQLFDELFKK